MLLKKAICIFHFENEIFRAIFEVIVGEGGGGCWQRLLIKKNGKLCRNCTKKVASNEFLYSQVGAEQIHHYYDDDVKT